MNSLLRCAVLSCAAVALGACSIPSLPEPNGAQALTQPRLSAQTVADTTTAGVDTGGTVATESDGEPTTTPSETGGQGIGTLGSGN
jgi:hypothetical protein